jgi:hypothetical protein
LGEFWDVSAGGAGGACTVEEGAWALDTLKQVKKKIPARKMNQTVLARLFEGRLNGTVNVTPSLRQIVSI